MGKRNAFTLAEVLITLGIIGVVAAMTMPTLLNSTQAARSKTGFKKVMNVLNQALVVHSALEDMTTADFTATTTNKGDDSLTGVFLERTNVVKTDSVGGNYVLYFNDGMTVEYKLADAKQCTEANPCKAVIDTIGGPGKGGDDTKMSGASLAATTTEKRVKTELITDRWPVRIIEDRVEPNNAAGRIIMYGTNTNKATAEQEQQSGGGS